MKKELETPNENYEAVVEYVNGVVKKAVDIEETFMAEALRDKHRNFRERDEAYNNLMHYAFGLKTAFNTLCKLLSTGDLKNERNNMESLHKYNPEAAKRLVDKLQDVEDLPFDEELPSDHRKTIFSMMKSIYAHHNRRISPFPNNFYYGLKDDEKIN